jgi:hypothetical protein
MTCRKRLACLLVLIAVVLISPLSLCSCDTEASSIFVFSPTDGATYSKDSVDLQIQVAQTNLDSAKITYTLDNKQYALETFQSHAGREVRVGEVTLSNLSEGKHTLVVAGTGDFFSYNPPCTQDFVPVTVHFFINTTLITPSPSPYPTEASSPMQTIATGTLALEFLLGVIALVLFVVIFTAARRHRKTVNK